jgi:hypothetical protein
MKTIFLRALEATDKAEALRSAIHNQGMSTGTQRFDVDIGSFSAISRSPFAYWVTDRILGLFKSMPAFSANGRIAASGGKTLDDFRWIRSTWEVIPRSSSEWVGFAKGGSYSPFYADIHLLLNWQADARSLKAYLVEYRSLRGWSPNWTAELHGSDQYLRPGLTWPRRTNGLSFRVMPAGCVFADKGPAAFVGDDVADELLALCAVANSKAFGLLVSLQLARTELAQSFEVGLIQRTPIPNLTALEQSTLASLARRAWSTKRNIDSRSEISHAFFLPALLQVRGDTLTARAVAWAEKTRAQSEDLAAIQAEINDCCFGLYTISESDCRAVDNGLAENLEKSPVIELPAEEDAGFSGDPDDEADADDGADAVTLGAELISWAFGVAIGRFDIRLATGMRALPGEPEPFDVLPVSSPAILSGDDGLPLRRPPDGYPILFPPNGILVDDEGHAQDVVGAVRGVFEETFNICADTWWRETSALLDPKAHSLRTWISAHFFDHHLKRYCKSRRKAPVMWQIAIRSGRYCVWLYSQRLTKDTIFQVQNDVVAPKLAHEERQLANLIQVAGSNPSATERKEIADREAFVEELRSLLEEAKRVAPLWNPELDDGVMLTMAPLWRLVPQNKPWQKDLKAKWDELAAGKYDWAHVAMHLWPERVVPKCATDRSLAIAHGLEDVFWAEGGDGKWSRRPVPTRPVDELVRERTSVAVKAALKDLSEASAPNGSKARARRSSS